MPLERQHQKPCTKTTFPAERSSSSTRRLEEPPVQATGQQVVAQHWCLPATLPGRHPAKGVACRSSNKSWSPSRWPPCPSRSPTGSPLLRTHPKPRPGKPETHLVTGWHQREHPRSFLPWPLCHLTTHAVYQLIADATNFCVCFLARSV